MNPISLLGALGLLKFFFDKIAVTSMLRALKVMRTVLLDTAAQTSTGDRQRMLVDIGTKLGTYLDNQTTKEAKVNVAYKVGKLAHQAYQYFVPGFVPNRPLHSYLHNNLPFCLVHKSIELVKVHIDDNPADLLTKSLP